MMLVEHDVEAELVAELPLVVIAMEQVGGDARIALSVRERHPQRAGMLIPRRVIGLFGEVIDSHGPPLSSSAKADDPVFIDILITEPRTSTTARDYWTLRFRGA